MRAAPGNRDWSSRGKHSKDEGWWLDLNLELWYHVANKGRLNRIIVLRPKGDYIESTWGTQEENPRLGDYTNTLNSD
jgi:hypothetical protein